MNLGRERDKALAYESFLELMEQVIVPRFEADPNSTRIGSKALGGGPRMPSCYFVYRGRTWRVHGDSAYQPLMIAYKAMKSGALPYPFVEKTKSRGSGLCLLLHESLAPVLASLPIQRMYIYEAETSGQ